MKPHGGIEKRVFMHYKALKRSCIPEYKVTKTCGHMNACPSKPFFGHVHGYWVLTTPNHVWLNLARTHKMPVRQVKDIVTKMRER